MPSSVLGGGVRNVRKEDSPLFVLMDLFLKDVHPELSPKPPLSLPDDHRSFLNTAKRKPNTAIPRTPTPTVLRHPYPNMSHRWDGILTVRGLAL